MEFLESPLFSKLIEKYLKDEEYAALQWELATKPEAGVLIPGSGGLRKIRWACQGRGKRGGIRVIYFYKTQKAQIWLLTVYAKNEVENLSSLELNRIKKELDL